MRSGQLRDRLTIQQPVAADANDYGEQVDSWTTLDKVWGEVIDLFGLELERAAMVTPEATVTVKLRYRADVTEAMRLKDGDRLLYIEAIIPDVRKSEMTCFCREER